MVQIKISEGIVIGEQLKNEYGGTIYSFKGIPYAEPPVGDLRFKAPVKVKPWGVREAKQFGPRCPQYNVFTKTFEPGNEDCLYLNVYSPNLTPTEPLPVMFWIHGGAFVCGSGDSAGPEFLIRHDVILVTINYRLEVLGFLSLETKDIPGNAGMKDQVEAMRWVQKNIGHFGGNPNNVTIFGESAGGACVSYHLMSPMTKGLFKRAIVQSGSSTNCWSQSSMPREIALVLARNLGFESEDDKELYEFFKSQPVEALVNAQVSLTYFENYKVNSDIQFSVVSEKDYGNNEVYFSGNVFEELCAGIHEGVEVMNGYTEHEGTLMVVNKDKHEDIFKEANMFPEFFVPKRILMQCSIPEVLAIGKMIKKFYFGQEKISTESINTLIKFYTMYVFAFGIILWQNICALKKRNKIFLYKFTCKSERKLIKTEEALGATPYTSHADDLTYIFPLGEGEPDLDTNSKAFKMINNVTKLWTNFAKYGDPTPDQSDDSLMGIKWLPYTLAKKSYLNIGEHLILEENPEQEDVKLWNSIFKKFYPFAISEN